MTRLPEPWFRAAWALATLAVAAFIAYQSTRGGGDPTVPELTTTGTYVGHVGVYAVLAFCGQTAAFSRRISVLVAVIAGAALFGVCLEAYQSTLDGRTGSIEDALANLGGAILGAAVAYALQPRWRWLLITEN